VWFECLTQIVLLGVHIYLFQAVPLLLNFSQSRQVYASLTSSRILDLNYPRDNMDTSNSTPAYHAPAQGTARGGSPGLSPLAGGGQAEAEAAAFWCPPPLPEGDPRRADQEFCGLGVRLEGGDLHLWHEVQPRTAFIQGGGLGGGQEAGGGGQVLGHRAWGDAQVRDVWTMWAVEVGWLTGWDHFMDSHPYWW